MSRVGRCVFLPAEHKVVRAGCEGGKRRVGETLVPMSPELSRGGAPLWKLQVREAERPVGTVKVSWPNSFRRLVWSSLLPNFSLD